MDEEWSNSEDDDEIDAQLLRDEADPDQSPERLALRAEWLKGYVYDPNQHKPCCRQKCSEKYSYTDVTSSEFNGIDKTSAYELSHKIGMSECMQIDTSKTKLLTHARRDHRKKNTVPARKTNRTCSGYDYTAEFKYVDHRICRSFFLYVHDIKPQAWYAARRLISAHEAYQEKNPDATYTDTLGSFFTAIEKDLFYCIENWRGCREVFIDLLAKSRHFCCIQSNGTVKNGYWNEILHDEMRPIATCGYYYTYGFRDVDEDAIWDYRARSEAESMELVEDENAQKKRATRINDALMEELRVHIADENPYFGRDSSIREIHWPNSEFAIAHAFAGNETENIFRNIRNVALENSVFFYRPECTQCFASDAVQRTWSPHLPANIATTFAPSPSYHVAIHAAGSYAQERILEMESLLYDIALTKCYEDIHTKKFRSTFLDFGLSKLRLPSKMSGSNQTVEICDPNHEISIFFFKTTLPSKKSSNRNPNSNGVLLPPSPYLHAHATSLAMGLIDQHFADLHDAIMEHVRSEQFKAERQEALSLKRSFNLTASTYIRMTAVSGLASERLSLRAHFSQVVYDFTNEMNNIFAPWGNTFVFILNAQMHETTTMHCASSFFPSKSDRVLHTAWLGNSRETAMIYNNIDELQNLLSRKMPNFTWHTMKTLSDVATPPTTPRYEVLEKYEHSGVIRVLGVTRPHAINANSVIDSIGLPFHFTPAAYADDRIRYNIEPIEYAAFRERFAKILCIARILLPKLNSAACFESLAFSSGTCPCDITEAEFVNELPTNTKSAVVSALEFAVSCASSSRACHKRMESNVANNSRRTPVDPSYTNTFSNPKRRAKMKNLHFSMHSVNNIPKRKWNK